MSKVFCNKCKHIRESDDGGMKISDYCKCAMEPHVYNKNKDCRHYEKATLLTRMKTFIQEDWQILLFMLAMLLIIIAGFIKEGCVQ